MTSNPDPPPSPPPTTGSRSQGWFDLMQLVNRCMGSLELADRLVLRFSQRLPGLEKELQEAADQNDLACMQSLAHKLKGEAANIASERLSHLAARTEQLAEMGFTAEAVNSIAELIEGCRTFREQAIAFSQLAGQQRTEDPSPDHPKP